MVLFDYEKIWLLSGGQSKLIVQYFRGLYFRRPEYDYLKGSSFVLKPEVIVNNPHRLAKRTLAEYLGLCALRNYSNYQQFRDVNLDLEYFPDYIPKQIVEQNPLVTLEKTKLIFKEEVL